MREFLSKKVVALSLLMAVLVLAPSCAVMKMKEIRVSSCSIVSISPRSFRSADALLRIGIDNPSLPFSLDEVEGIIRKDETVLATFGGGPIEVEGRCDDIYDLPCKVSIADGVTILDLLAVLGEKDFTNYYVDISGYVGINNGRGHKLKMGNIPLQSLIDKASGKNKTK